MSIETQKSMIIKFFQEVLENGKLTILEKILKPECSYIDAGELKFTNRRDFIEYVREGRKPYTDIDVFIHDIVAEGEKVAVRCTYRHATKTVQTTFAVMGFFQFQEGKIVKIWRNIVISDEQEKKSS